MSTDCVTATDFCLFLGYETAFVQNVTLDLFNFVALWKIKTRDELRVQIHELRDQIHELQVQIHKIRVQIHELRVQNHELRYEFEFTSHKFKSTS